MHVYRYLRAPTSVHLYTICVRWATNGAGINCKYVWPGNCKCAGVLRSWRDVACIFVLCCSIYKHLTNIVSNKYWAHCTEILMFILDPIIYYPCFSEMECKLMLWNRAILLHILLHKFFIYIFNMKLWFISFQTFWLCH